jgi:uncharacterized protein (TIGR00369 family)
VAAEVISADELRDRIPFVRDLGIELTTVEPGRSRLELDVLPRHMNGWGVVHGGVMMTLLDVAMAVAARALEPAANGSVTVEMKTTFMQAGPPDGRLAATGVCVHRSTTLAFCEAEIRDVNDRLLARATGTFKFRRRSAPAAALATNESGQA